MNSHFYHYVCKIGFTDMLLHDLDVTELYIILNVWWKLCFAFFFIAFALGDPTVTLEDVSPRIYPSGALFPYEVFFLLLL